MPTKFYTIIVHYDGVKLDQSHYLKIMYFEIVTAYVIKLVLLHNRFFIENFKIYQTKCV